MYLIYKQIIILFRKVLKEQQTAQSEKLKLEPDYHILICKVESYAVDFGCCRAPVEMSALL